jgi:hypothetical protein
MATAYNQAFQADTGSLWAFGPNLETLDRGVKIMPGSSPSVASLQHHFLAVAFSADTGHLWTLDPDLGAVDRGLEMMQGTSPSITLVRGDTYAVAFQAKNGDLWTLDPAHGAVDRGLGMMQGTSPSITLVRGDAYAVAFQANTGYLWTFDLDQGALDRGLGMMQGTSPSIALLRGGNTYAVAYQANTGDLWTLDPDEGAVDRGLGMMQGTSPSIAPLDGGNTYAVAFQANTGRLWTLDPDRGAVDRELGMMQGTSPSIAPLDGGNTYAVAFQANTGRLWTHDPDLGGLDRGMKMKPGTSPSIKAAPPGPPKAPGVTLSEVTDSTVTIAIQGPSPSLISSYVVGWHAPPSTDHSEATLPPSMSSFTASPLAPGTRYNFFVRYHTLDHRHSIAGELQAMTSGSPPLLPRVKVPQVVGTTMMAASQTLTNVGLEFGFVWNPTGEIEMTKLWVVSQSPDAGVFVAPDSRIDVSASTSMQPAPEREAMEWQAPPRPQLTRADPMPAPSHLVLADRSPKWLGVLSPEASGPSALPPPLSAPAVAAAWGDACADGPHASASCCAGGDSFINNSAHFLSNAFIGAGYTELLTYGARCPAHRPLRAREMHEWFKTKSSTEPSGESSTQLQRGTGWWAVFQLDEQVYWCGHVALLDSDNWVYYGTAWYGSWSQYLYRW